MNYKLSEIALINPKESLPSGSLAKKVAMEKLQPFCRDIDGFELTKYNGGTKFRNGDTIMARITPCLENGKIAKVNILDEKEIGFGSTEYIIFRAKPGVTDEDFLYYLITSPIVRNPAIKSMVGSSGRQRVQTDVIQNLEIDVPELTIQKKIGSILKRIDDKIELNRKINDNLMQQLNSVYHSIFDSTIFEKKVPLGDYFDVSIGKTPPRKEQWWFSTNTSDVKWVSISDMGSCGTFISSTSEYLTNEAITKFNVVLVPDNTVILSFKLTVGRLAITDGEMATNEAIAHFKTNNKTINPYLYMFLKNYKYGNLGSTSSIATAVNSKIIKSIQFLVPGEKDIAKFNEVAIPMLSQIKEIQHEVRALSELRDSLLPKLMSGEIDVDSIEL